MDRELDIIWVLPALLVIVLMVVSYKLGVEVGKEKALEYRSEDDRI